MLAYGCTGPAMGQPSSIGKGRQIPSTGSGRPRASRGSPPACIWIPRLCCGTVIHDRDCPRGGNGENPWNDLKAEIMIKRQFEAILTGLMLTVFFAGVGTADPVGVWLTPSGNSQIEIRPCGEKLCGKLVWFTEPRNTDGTLKLDEKNKNVALRNRPLLGLQMMSSFIKTGDGKWTKGRIYNPEDGQTYRSKLEVKDQNTLSVSGCVLFFCKDQIWTRVK